MQKQLPGGLILRSLSENYASDRERLPDFCASIDAANEIEPIKDAVRHWVRDMMSGHPTITLDDLFVVVDPAKDDMVVSSTLLIPQTWRYEDIVIGVGRPELVATHPEYRSRGLVRVLFEAVHERSAALGHQLQAVTGIPHFYRQFGYTMAVDLGAHAVFPLVALPDLKPDYQPAFTLRPATTDDIPNITQWSAYFARERLLTDAFSPDEWRYEITGRRWGYYPHTDYQIIVNTDGLAVGYLTLLSSRAEMYETRCTAYVVGDQSSYLATFDDVMQGIKRWALSKYGYCPAMLAFASGIHDSLDTLVERSRDGHLRPRRYAFYLRLADTIGFLKTIRPMLERRLDGSGAHRYTGELRIGFHNLTGISLQFEAGRLRDIVPISGKDGYDVSFPWNLLWNVIFGYHNHDDINRVLPDDGVNAKAIVLMDILFPRKKSFLQVLS
jgi:GNAT superfamily N-acetyltransferase